MSVILLRHYFDRALSVHWWCWTGFFPQKERLWKMAKMVTVAIAGNTFDFSPNHSLSRGEQPFPTAGCSPGICLSLQVIQIQKFNLLVQQFKANCSTLFDWIFPLSRRTWPWGNQQRQDSVCLGRGQSTGATHCPGFLNFVSLSLPEWWHYGPEIFNFLGGTRTG